MSVFNFRQFSVIKKRKRKKKVKNRKKENEMNARCS